MKTRVFILYYWPIFLIIRLFSPYIFSRFPRIVILTRDSEKQVSVVRYKVAVTFLFMAETKKTTYIFVYILQILL